ncbi:beta-1,3-galactosyltransferase 1 isoform X4 [Corapipo altera]|uniref:beta-1,3-galactosyltransferase 1 isoform X4 n=1 Tax=Corapipo altera TaxID=415028 RepID=UPI000FD6985C|nr:beta-1,3-galactosyltransferase 1 isoform X4 [Corapipo altera]
MRSGCGSGGGSGRGERPAGRGWRARPMLNLGGVVITPELSARELVRVSRCWKAREKSWPLELSTSKRFLQLAVGTN